MNLFGYGRLLPLPPTATLSYHLPSRTKSPFASASSIHLPAQHLQSLNRVSA